MKGGHINIKDANEDGKRKMVTEKKIYIYENDVRERSKGGKRKVREREREIR